MSETIQTASDDTFDQETSQGLVLLDFYADWCGPCKMLTPVIEELAGKLGSQARFVKVDVEQAQKSAMKFEVSAIPTLVLLKDGKEVDRLSGLQDGETIEQMIQKHS